MGSTSTLTSRRICILMLGTSLGALLLILKTWEVFKIKVVPSYLMPKLVKGNSLHSKQAILHSLVHTENRAIDLSLGIIVHFGIQESVPIDFFTNFIRVAQDEGRHFTLLAAKLQQLGSFYRTFPCP